MAERFNIYPSFHKFFFFFNLLSLAFVSLPTLFAAESDVLSQAHTDIFHAYLRSVPEAISSPILDVFVICSRDDPKHTQKAVKLCDELVLTGIPPARIYFEARPGGEDNIFTHIDKVSEAKRVIVIGSPGLKKECKGKGVTTTTIERLRTRLLQERSGVIPVWFDGNYEDCFPGYFLSSSARDLRVDYHLTFFDFLMDFYQGDSPNHPIRTLKEEFVRLKDIPPSVLNDYSARRLRFEEEQKEKDVQKLIAILDNAQAKRENVQSPQAAKALQIQSHQTATPTVEMKEFREGITSEDVLEKCAKFSRNINNYTSGIQSEVISEGTTTKIYSESDCIYVAFHGTAVFTILRAGLEEVESFGVVHTGLYGLFNGLLKKELYRKLTDFAENNTRDIVFSGHGSGGAVALLAGANFAKTVKTKSNRIKIVTFSIPSLGDQDFKTAVEGIVGKGNIYNFCSKMDPAITSINNLTYAACLFNRKVWSANPGNHFELQQTSLRKGLTLLAAGVMFPGIILAAGAPLAASSVALGVSVGGLYLANQHHESIPVDFDGVTSKKV